MTSRHLDLTPFTTTLWVANAQTQARACTYNMNITYGATEVSDLGKKGNELTQPREVQGVAAKSLWCCHHSSTFSEDLLFQQHTA